ncbi:Ribonucleotide reductase of class Ia (aerobic)alpha subunit [Salmonella enterica subsp. enterica]|uniref:Ribonucleotide reductase of class Ia (Aerobic)alpha subunit n=1 Tax=Salmonella enterica I TaxID=59201 RepID=A0A379W6I8_SALET|nr:Ribonucleotide reductase of class Ia (aerobic)alpha subunit [Salmonella enterica subsp. enterica]
MKAVELFSLMMQERASTGRIYIQNVDHCNTHSPFDPVVARYASLTCVWRLPCRPNR